MLAAADAIATALEDAAVANDVNALVITDARLAHPPCFLLVPPERVYDLACGVTLVWSLFGLVPGPGGADAWRMLDDLAVVVEDAFGPESAASDAAALERAVSVSYVLPDAPDAVPGLLFTLRESR